MVGRLLIVLDGAPEPGGPTTLEAAHTPALDRLCRRGAVSRLRTTPPGLEPGSETGIPTLLGAPPAAPPGRGWIEAAAAGIAVPEGERPWRIDLFCAGGRRAIAEPLRDAVAERLPRHRLVSMRGHRLLAIGEGRPELTEPLDAVEISVWPDGELPAPTVDPDVVMVCGPGAAAGCGRLLGLTVHIPPGATGDIDTSLSAKAGAASDALHAGSNVVVHVGGLDEASHRRDTVAKRRALERADAELIAPLAAPARTVAITSDHSTCPRTGRHGAEPVPLVVAGPAVKPAGPDRLTERAVAAEAVAASPWEPALAEAAA